jgi:hypothetical protein
MGGLRNLVAEAIICMLVHHADKEPVKWRCPLANWKHGGESFFKRWKSWEIFGPA